MKILVVDSDVSNRKLSKLLSKESYVVDSAFTGEEGMRKLELHDYDAILLKMMQASSYSGGLETLTRIRQVKPTPVMLLAEGEEDDFVTELDLGADDYVRSTIDSEELKARLRAILRRRYEVSRPKVTCQGHTLDLKGKRLMKGRKQIHLTVREYCLVEFLMLHRGRVISRECLLDQLGYQMNLCESNLLDVHISRVRQKVGKAFILTHRGFGYSIP